MARTFSARPADIFGITGEYRRFCFDSAVMTFGLALENELDAVEGKTAVEINRKRQRVMNKWLDVPQKFKEPPGVGMREQRVGDR